MDKVYCNQCKWFSGTYIIRPKIRYHCEHDHCFRESSSFIDGIKLERIFYCDNLNSYYDCRYFEQRLTIWKTITKFFKMMLKKILKKK